MTKTQEDIRKAVFSALHEIVPEADLDTLNSEVSLRGALDIDSVDFFRFIMKLRKELNIDVPETDYAKLSTLNSCVEYLCGVIQK